VAGPGEDLSYLVGDWRIFQRKGGHRWSLDDFLTAFVAFDEAERHGAVSRMVDLGCGIGSVLFMLAWALPTARAVGIEAQELSIGLARRSLAYNGAEDRCDLRHGDLRDPAMLPEGACFDLVTGTPPYIPLGRGLVSSKVQRGPCCFEMRGGLEEYCEAASAALAPQGRFVVCAGAWPPDRAERAAEKAGLRIARRMQVIPREGKSLLLEVFTMVARRATAALSDAEPEPELVRFVVRDLGGNLTADMHEARRRMGLPPAMRRAPKSST